MPVHRDCRADLKTAASISHHFDRASTSQRSSVEALLNLPSSTAASRHQFPAKGRPLDPAKAEAGFGDAVSPVVGFGVSFPASNSGVKVEYKGNNVLWEQEYGSSE